MKKLLLVTTSAVLALAIVTGIAQAADGFGGPFSDVVGSAPSGAAGGTLAGTYPNPTMADAVSIGTGLSIGSPGGAAVGISVKASADGTITGTTTVNQSVFVVGVGTHFTTELVIGDAIGVSSNANVYGLVVAITDDTHLTVANVLGNGTSQTINLRQRAFRYFTNAGDLGFALGTGSLGATLVNGFDANFSLTRYATNGNLTLKRVDGTRAVPTALQSGEPIGVMSWAGFDGVGTSPTTATMTATTGSTWTTSNHESFITFAVTPSGSTTTSSALVLRSDGLLTLSSSYTASSLPVIDSSRVVRSRAYPATCTLNAASPSQCTLTVTSGSTVCWCSPKGATAAIAAAGCAWGISGTTLTITSANGASNDVAGGCY